MILSGEISLPFSFVWSFFWMSHFLFLVLFNFAKASYILAFFNQRMQGKPCHICIYLYYTLRLRFMFIIFLINLFIYLFVCLFLAALGLCCCMWTFSSCGERGLLFVAVHRLLIAVASLAVHHGL